MEYVEPQHLEMNLKDVKPLQISFEPNLCSWVYMCQGLSDNWGLSNIPFMKNVVFINKEIIKCTNFKVILLNVKQNLSDWKLYQKEIFFTME